MTSRPSPILEAGTAVASGPILLFSAYLLFAGHNQPGGGFAGGLVAGVAILLAWAGGGPTLVRRIIPIRSSALMGAGLGVAASVGLASLIAGQGFLESGYVTLDAPLVGEVKIVSALGFDLGVYLVVIGMALALTRALGERRGTAPGDESA